MMKELIEKKLVINFDVFEYKLNVILTNSIDISRNKISNKVGVPKGNFNNTSGLHSHNDNDAEAFLFLTKYSGCGTIAHEASHAVYRMFEYYGLDFDDENFAYHLGFVVEKIYDFIITNNKKIK